MVVVGREPSGHGWPRSGAGAPRARGGEDAGVFLDGQNAIAAQIVAAMQAVGYQLPSPAPYAGPGAGTHGDPNQFIAAAIWFPGKSRN